MANSTNSNASGMTIQRRYTVVAIWLHWLIALAISANLALGWWMSAAINHAAQQATAIQLYQLHKSIGLCILLLSVLRLLWRLLKPPPALPSQMPKWQIQLARITHGLLYLLLITIPLTGWLYVSTQWRLDGPLNVPTLLFGLVEIPHVAALNQLSDPSRAHWSSQLLLGHQSLVWSLCGLLILHIGAALKHQFLNHDGLLIRLIPRQRPYQWVVITGCLLPVLVIAGLAQLPQVHTQSSQQNISSGTLEYMSDAPIWQLHHNHSAIRFSGSHAGNPFQGQFQHWQLSLPADFDSKSAQIIATIETASATDGDPLHDSALKESDWFAVQQYPHATYRSTAIQALGNNRYIIQGTLTIKQHTHTVAPLMAEVSNEQLTIHGTVNLQRSDFALGMSSDPDGAWVSAQIQVRVQVSATRLSATP